MDIRTQLKKFGASKYAFYEDDRRIGFEFEFEGRRIRIMTDYPDPDAEEFRLGGRGSGSGRLVERSEEQKFTMWQKECNRRWRVLVLAVKSKLITVTEQVRTFEQEFLYDIVLPNNQTVGEYIVPQIEQSYLTQKMPPLLPGIGETK